MATGDLSVFEYQAFVRSLICVGSLGHLAMRRILEAQDIREVSGDFRARASAAVARLRRSGRVDGKHRTACSDIRTLCFMEYRIASEDGWFRGELLCAGGAGGGHLLSGPPHLCAVAGVAGGSSCAMLRALSELVAVLEEEGEEAAARARGGAELLVTCRVLCASCAGVALQIRTRFPGVRLEVGLGGPHGM